MDIATRIWRSPYSPFGQRKAVEIDGEAETIIAEQVYTDRELAGIAADGFNAIWVHGLLHQLVHSPVFPELGRNSGLHLEAMRKLIDRAAKHGVRVFLYLQPPRGLPTSHPFWAAHPEAGGHIERNQALDDSGETADFRCFCTSQPVVRHYLRDAFERLAAALPELGGVILITASEYTSHCVGRCGHTLGAMGEPVEIRTTCPHCSEREPAEIIAEIIASARDGIRAVSETMQIWAWNWSWTFYYDIPCREIIAKLPHDVVLMLGLERGGRQDYCGRKDCAVNEYSISYAGPSEQCRKGFEAAREFGLKTAVKLQFATTHELATVVSLPLIGNLYRKAACLRANRTAGYMGCWNFGNMASANTAAFNYFLSPECPDDEARALQRFAADYLPGCEPETAMKAWHAFAAAMRHYPFSISYLYAGPTNYSLAYVPRPEALNGIPAGRSWLDDVRGDDLSGCLADFPLDEIIAGFEKLSAQWAEGVRLLESALHACRSPHAAAELDNARICGACFHSTWNTFRFYRLRSAWDDDRAASYADIARDELAVLKTIRPVVARDGRQGYHSEAHAHLFDEAKIQYKIDVLEKQLLQLERK